jgi:hypothetical protein
MTVILAWITFASLLGHCLSKAENEHRELRGKIKALLDENEELTDMLAEVTPRESQAGVPGAPVITSD